MGKYILIFFLVVFFNLNLVLGENLSQKNSLLENRVELYLENMIEVYNSQIFLESDERLIKMYKNEFPLYEKVGFSFKIETIVSNKEKIIMFKFSTINSEEMIIDFKDNLSEVFSPNFISGDFISGIYMKDIYMENSETAIFEDSIIMSLHINNVLNNTLKNSKEEGIYWYKYHKNKIREGEINEIWGPFNKNNDLFDLWDPFNNIYERKFFEIMDFKKSIINNKIIGDENYSLEVFLLDFKNYNISLEHYKQFNDLIKIYNKFLYQYSGIEFNDTNIQKINLIRYEIFNNESYLLKDLEKDLKILNNSILKEIEMGEPFYKKKFLLLIKFMGTDYIVLGLIAIFTLVGYSLKLLGPLFKFIKYFKNNFSYFLRLKLFSTLKKSLLTYLKNKKK